jgi:nucleoside-diphosphate-sugar epimerase
MKVLITGAGGFVGRALVPYLRDCDFEVVAATRKGTEAGEVAVSDISYSTDWETALVGCHAVVHAAARVHRMEESALEGLEQARRVNTHGSLRLARQAAAAGVHRFIFISSVKVSGEAGFFSADSPCDPRDAYGISKHEAEVGLAEISTQTGMQLIVLRLPLVYGPGVGGNFLRLMSLVENGLPLPLGAVTNLRSMVYLGNLVDAIRTCLQSPIVGNHSWYVSDGEDISTAELIRMLASAMGVKLCLLRVPTLLLKMGAVAFGKTAAARRLLGSLTVDSELMCTELGWQPPYSLSQGLRATADWYQQQTANE